MDYRTLIIKELIDRTTLSQKAFAERAGIPYTTLRSILQRGIGNATIDNVLKVCKALEITTDQLEALAVRRETVVNGSNELVSQYNAIHNPSTTKISSYKEIPYFGSVSAGKPFTVEAAYENDVEKINIPTAFLGNYAASDDLLSFNVNGDSMNQVFPHDATLIAKRVNEHELKNGDIVVYQYDGEYAVKRFRKDEDAQVYIFSPDSNNPNFKETIVRMDSAGSLKIEAKVIWYSVVL